MNSGDLKTYKYVKVSKSDFFTTTILFLHNICSERNKMNIRSSKVYTCVISKFRHQTTPNLISIGEINLKFIYDVKVGCLSSKF